MELRLAGVRYTFRGIRSQRPKFSLSLNRPRAIRELQNAMEDNARQNEAHLSVG